MRGIFQTAISGTILVLLILSITGCTVVGYGVGAFADSKSEKKVVSVRKIPDAVKTGDYIYVTLSNGAVFEGEYSGMEVISDDEYLERYREIRLQNSENIRLPAIGDTLTIFLKPARIKVHKIRTFNGFVTQSTKYGRESLIRGKYLKSQKDERIYLNRICRITDNRGNETDLDRLNEFIASGGMDKLTSIVLKHRKGYHRIPSDNIREVRLKPKKRFASIAAAAGLIVDIFIYFVFIYEPDRDAGASSGGG